MASPAAQLQTTASATTSMPETEAKAVTKSQKKVSPGVSLLSGAVAGAVEATITVRSAKALSFRHVRADQDVYSTHSNLPRHVPNSAVKVLLLDQFRKIHLQSSRTLRSMMA